MIELQKIIEVLKPKKVIGNTNISIKKPIKLTPNNNDLNAIMWAGSKYYNTLKNVSKGTVICEAIKKEDISPLCTYLLVDKPRNSFRLLLTSFFTPPVVSYISKTAIIADDVQLGRDVYIGENVILESGCIIGDRTFIGHNTVVKRDTEIGAHVKIGSNNVIGGVGFGYEKSETGQYELIPHIGNVIIEDGVEIGNNTTIDRAVLGSTILQKNVKIDNLVHIAHGVNIGSNSLIIANAMIAGSVSVGANVWVAPSTSILNKVSIEDNAVIGMGAVVLKSVENGHVIVGNPGKILRPKTEANE